MKTRETASLVKQLDKASSRYGMEISAKKTKLITNSAQPISTKITVSEKELETDDHFKYIGTMKSEEGLKTETLARVTQTATAMARMKIRDRNITLGTKLKLQRALVISIKLYACEAWTLIADLQKGIQAVKMIWLIRLLGISYKDHVTNNEVRRRFSQKCVSMKIY